MEDVDRSNVLIHFSEPEGTYTHGGRFVEVGFALAACDRVYNVGPPENIFLRLEGCALWNGVEQFATWEDAWRYSDV
ncbi:hypothetical protein LCGC14_1461140 [marine sediment metagenome]|uniref:Uncharacterized protein n=1 Tax=marine sediment metagenome TaxID=412755 RepID=A0A0F9MH29_9ZZZZ